MRNPSKRLVLTMIALAWSILFLQFAAPRADAEGLKPVSKLNVLDANKKLVGVADLAVGNVQVIFQLGNLTFTVAVRDDHFAGGDFLRFESADCSGTPWMTPVSHLLLSNAAIQSPGNTVYIPDPVIAPQIIIPRSVSFEGACSGWSSFGELLVPAQPVIDLLTVFTPPFTVR